MVDMSSIKQNYSLCLSTVIEFAPFIFLHSEEEFWPSDVDSFLPHMNIQTGDVAFFEGALDRATLALQAQSLGGKNFIDGAHLQEKLTENYLWKRGTKPTSASQIHCYTVITESKDLLCVQITYWWFFNYDNGLLRAKIGIFEYDDGRVGYGNRMSDWKHVTIFLNRSPLDGTFSLQQFRFQAHDNNTFLNKESINIEFGDVAKKQVTVYMAKGSHECYPKAGKHITPLSTNEFCDQGLGFDTKTSSFEIYTFVEVIAFEHFAEKHVDTKFNNPDWLDYRGRWGNLALTELSYLGPPDGEHFIRIYADALQGMNRPDEYSLPCSFEIGLTGQRCSGSPTVVWFQGKYICYYKADNSGDIYYITSLNGLQWTLAATRTPFGCSDEPVAVVFDNEVHLLFRDGGGHGLLHASSSTGYFELDNPVDYAGIDIDWKPSAAVIANKCLVVLARGHNTSDIVYAKFTAGTNGDKGSWSGGQTSFHCNRAPSVVYYRDEFIGYFQDPDGNGILFITSADGTKWENKLGDGWCTKFDTSSAPGAVVANDRVWIFYRDKDSDRILSILSITGYEGFGIKFFAPPICYTGLNSNDSPTVVHIDHGLTVLVARANGGGNEIQCAVNPALYNSDQARYVDPFPPIIVDRTPHSE